MHRNNFNAMARSIAASLFFFNFLNGPVLLAGPDIDNSKTNYTENFLTWLKTNRDSDTGLPFSHVGDVRFQHWTITYDAAVVALAYSADGKYTEARKILDYYIDTPDIWRLGGIVEAYIAGNPLLVKDWSVRSGANIWMGIAGVNLYLNTGDQKYLKFAERIADLALSLQNTDKNNPNFGGIALGPKGDPAFASDQYLGYDPQKPEFCRIYATEVSIDAYALFHKLYQVTGDKKYQYADAGCFHWLKLNAWNRAEQRFNRGYRDKIVATDVQSWGISALGMKGLDYIERGAAEKMTAFVEENCLEESSLDVPGKGPMLIRGVDFTDKKRVTEMGRKQMVSFEWSFQLINAYNRLVHDFTLSGENKKAEMYRQKREQLLGQLLVAAIADSGGLAYPYATLADAEIGHENRTPAMGNLSAIGGAWAILAIKGCDPLTVYSCVDLAK